MNTNYENYQFVVSLENKEAAAPAAPSELAQPLDHTLAGKSIQVKAYLGEQEVPLTPAQMDKIKETIGEMIREKPELQNTQQFTFTQQSLETGDRELPLMERASEELRSQFPANQEQVEEHVEVAQREEIPQKEESSKEVPPKTDQQSHQSTDTKIEKMGVEDKLPDLSEKNEPINFKAVEEKPPVKTEEIKQSYSIEDIKNNKVKKESAGAKFFKFIGRGIEIIGLRLVLQLSATIREYSIVDFIYDKPNSLISKAFTEHCKKGIFL